MDSQGVRIVVACALGAMGGLIVALRVPEMIWWLGALVGAFASGGIYAWREILLNSRKAAKISWRGLSLLPKIWAEVSLIWAEVNLENRYLLFGVVCFFLSLSSLLLIVTVSFELGLRELGYTLGVLFPLPQIFVVFVSLLYYINGDNLSGQGRLFRARRFFIFSTPLGVFFIYYLAMKNFPKVMLMAIVFFWRVVLPMLGALLVGLAEGLAELVKFCFNFTKNLFILIHSKVLILCFIDGALGVMFSYLVFYQGLGFEGGPTVLWGGLVGALFGAVHYEIVSKRVLHLVA